MIGRRRGAVAACLAVLLLAVPRAGASSVPARPGPGLAPPACLVADPNEPADAIFATKLRRAAATTPRDQFPVEARPGATAWATAGSWHWAAGFVPGQLWEFYLRTGDPSWRALALAMDTTLPREARDRGPHDLGFMLGSPYMPAFAATGDPRYRALLEQGAATLDTHWRDRPGVLWSLPPRPGHVEIIVDSAMNMDLLLWAAEHGGSPQLRAHALSHLRHLAVDGLRADGSTVHVIDYDAATGRRLRTYTRQGFSDASAWSRGQAWFFTGLAQGYRHTHDPVLLSAATRAADYYLGHLPSDRVPYWDMSQPAGSSTPRDTAAGAVAAFGLGVLADVTPDAANRARWQAESLLETQALLRPPYLAPASHPAVLTHAAHGQKGIALQAETSFPYADYYLLRSLFALEERAQPVGAFAGGSGCLAGRHHAVTGSVPRLVAGRPGRVRV